MGTDLSISKEKLWISSFSNSIRKVKIMWADIFKPGPPAAPYI